MAWPYQKYKKNIYSSLVLSGLEVTDRASPAKTRSKDSLQDSLLAFDKIVITRFKTWTIDYSFNSC